MRYYQWHDYVVVHLHHALHAHMTMKEILTHLEPETPRLLAYWKKGYPAKTTALAVRCWVIQNYKRSIKNS